jgi:excisionase family DNA binding protein
MSERLTISEAAEFLEASRSTVHKLAREGKISVVQNISGRPMYLKDSLEKYVKRSSRNDILLDVYSRDEHEVCIGIRILYSCFYGRDRYFSDLSCVDLSYDEFSNSLTVGSKSGLLADICAKISKMFMLEVNFNQEELFF